MVAVDAKAKADESIDKKKKKKKSKKGKKLSHKQKAVKFLKKRITTIKHKWKVHQMKAKTRWLKTHKKTGQSLKKAWLNAKRWFKYKYLHKSSKFLGMKLTPLKNIWKKK